MKKILNSVTLLFASICFHFSIANAQDIEYDYATKKWNTLPQKVKSGTPINFTIKNVDSSLVVTINGKSTEIQIEKSEEKAVGIKAVKSSTKDYSISRIADKDIMQFTYIIRGADINDTDTLNIPVYGGWKINLSQGLGFTGNYNKYTDYNIKDSTIIGSTNSRYNPALFTFIHAHRRTASSFSYGLTVGLGFGLANQDLQFALGPSFIIGKEKRLILTGGISAFKANKLKAGYKEGDLFIGTEVPKELSYELGIFIGISFNLSGLNLGDIIKK